MSYLINSFGFPDEAFKVAKIYHGTNWPAVYIIHNSNEMYIGETTSAYIRYKQHADPNGSNYSARKKLSQIEIILADIFNKSAILDIEQSLIQMFEADNIIQREKGLPYHSLQNRNAGQSNQHDYYNRSIYQALIEEIWHDLVRMKIASNDFNVIRNSDFFKYSPYNTLTEEQEIACSEIIRDMMRTLLEGKEGSAIIRGSAGTGKSIVMINMIATLSKCQDIHYDYDPDSTEADSINDRIALHHEMIDFFEKWKTKTGYDNLKIGFVVPMSSIRSTFKSVFASSQGLTANMVIGPNDVVTNEPEREYDIVFVDEAHRLKRRKAMAGTEMHAFDVCCQKLGLDKNEATSLDFILTKTKYRVLVFDENQTIKPTDIPVEVFYSKLGNNFIEKTLTSQMRCRGGQTFTEFIDKIFNGNCNEQLITDNFDFRIFDNPNQLIEFIIEKDKSESLCRTLAGYSWEWVSSKEEVDGHLKKSKTIIKDLISLKKAGRKFDIIFDGKGYYWNVNPNRWILNSSPEEIGCIHTTQGYDLNRVGVIFGKEIDYDPIKKEITIDRSRFYDAKAKEGTDDIMLRKYIINAYKVMMVRGIKGCYVYACNPNLRNYLKNCIKTYYK